MSAQPWDPEKPRIKTEFQQSFMRERQRMQYTRHEISDQCSVPVDTVKRWETGEAIPNVQQFKKLFGLKGMRRLAKHPPEWGWASMAVLDGRFADQKADVADAVRQLNDQDPVTRPPPQTFGLGLSRIRDENEISQEQLGEILGITGQAVSQWERDETIPVQENFDKLLQVFPELEAAIAVGAVRLPEPKAIAVPVGNRAGRPRATTVDTMVEMAMEQSDAEREREPQRLKPRWNQYDVASIEEAKRTEPIMVVPPMPDPVFQTIGELAQTYGRARLAALQAKHAKEAAWEAFVNAETDHKNAEQEERESLEMLDLAIADEAKK